MELNIPNVKVCTKFSKKKNMHRTRHKQCQVPKQSILLHSLKMRVFDYIVEKLRLNNYFSLPWKNGKMACCKRITIDEVQIRQSK